jgi:hypothetical protein
MPDPVLAAEVGEDGKEVIAVVKIHGESSTSGQFVAAHKALRRLSGWLRDGAE